MRRFFDSKVVTLLFFALGFYTVPAISQVFQVGPGTTPTTGTTITPYSTFWMDTRKQYMVTASELIAVGASAGQITTVAFNVTSLPGQAMNSFNISMGPTLVPALTGAYEPGVSVYYSNPSLVVNSLGWNTYTLNSPYNWDGISNVLVEVCFDNNSYTSNGGVSYSITPTATNNYYYNDLPSASGCNVLTPNAASTSRPDMQFTILSAPCTAPPTAGTAVSSANPVCAGINFTLSLQGNSTGVGLTFQWQSSPDNIAWSDIIGATSGTYATSQSANTYYRCITTCSGQNDTSSVLFEQMTPFFQCYCSNSFANSTIDSYIGNVEVGLLNNNSVGNCAVYTDFTNLPPSPMFLGQSINVDIQTDDCEGVNFYQRGVKVFVDFNQNGLFSDVGEEVFVSPALTIQQTVHATGSFTVPLSALPGPTGMRVICQETSNPSVIQPCGTYGYGETEDYVVVIAPLPQNEARIADITNPSTGDCQIGDSVFVEIGTIGVQPLTSADVYVSVNGGPPVMSTWTGNITSGQTAPYYAGLFTLVDGDQLTVWTENPNGVVDSFPFNDTVDVVLYEALSGIYTVGGVAPDYTTINDALSALYLRGICSDVFFDLRNGTYTEQMTLSPYIGAGTNGRVTIRSEFQSADSVTVTYSSFSNLDNFIARFNDGDYFTLDALNLMFTNFGYANIIEFNGGADSNIITRCKIIGDTTAGFDNNETFTILSTLGNDNNNVISNNLIRGGSRAVSLSGTALLSPESGLRVENNVISDFYFVGLAGFNQNNPSFIGNEITTTSFNTNVFRMYLLATSGGGEVSGNFIHSDQGGFGINLDNVNGTSQNPVRVFNNFVYMGDSLNPTFSEGIFLQNGGSSINIYNNSVSLQSQGANTSGIRIQTGINNGVNVWNNNVVHEGAGYALFSDADFTLSASDYNNFLSASDLVHYGTNDYATLAAWQSAYGMDQNSQNVDPFFVNEDLHTCRVELDGAGFPMGLALDFDGDQRSVSTPDIGADEFVGASPFSLGPDTIICGGDAIVIGMENNQQATYLWVPLADTTAQVVANLPGTYILTVTSNCGTQTDSLVVGVVLPPTATFTVTDNFNTAVTTNNSTNGTSYFWTFGDGGTSTQFEPLHVYQNNGTYTITLTVYNECGDSSVFTRTVTIDVQYLGVDEQLAFDLNVYPNPTTGISTLNLVYGGKEMLEISIMDVTGRVLNQQEVNTGGGQIQVPLDLGGYAAGTYYIRVTDGEFSQVRKLLLTN